MTPERLIGMSREKIGIKTDVELCRRLGMVRQTFARKCKYPSTFTAGEIVAMSNLFSWTDSELGEFIRGCKG